MRALLVTIFTFLIVGCSSIGDFSRETYRKGFLSDDFLRDGVMGVLPLSGGEKTGHYLSTGREIFKKAISEIKPSMRPISLPLSATKEVWGEREFDALKETARFLLQTELQQVDLVEGVTYVRIKGRLWDVEQRDILWEGIGESRGHLFLFFPTVPASFETAMDVASRGLIRKFPTKE